MKCNAVLFAAVNCCGLLLTNLVCAALAEVTHGDFMVSPATDGTQEPYLFQFHGPTGKVKATIKVKGGFSSIWGHAVSQDGRYAAVGLTFPRPNAPPRPPPKYLASNQGPISDPVKIVFLQLAGRSPKVIGTKTLRSVNNGTEASCYYTDPGRTGYSSPAPLALRSKILPGSAGAVLDVYLSTMCPPTTITPYICRTYGNRYGISTVHHWSMTHNKFKILGPLTTRGRVAFPDRVKCGAAGYSITVAASGRVFAAFAFNAANKAPPDDTIGVYEVLRSAKGGTSLHLTWRFKNDPDDVVTFLATGPSTGCGIAWKKIGQGDGRVRRAMHRVSDQHLKCNL